MKAFDGVGKKTSKTIACKSEAILPKKKKQKQSELALKKKNTIASPLTPIKNNN